MPLPPPVSPPLPVTAVRSSRVPGPPRLAVAAARWPLPALVAWLLAWFADRTLTAAGAPAWTAAAAGLALCAGIAWRQPTRMRRAVVVAGWPASWLVAGAALPGWVWLLPAAALLALYPKRAWRDAPLFPTPPGALDALAGATGLPPGARVLDAGCGLGHGLRALRRAFPRARFAGVESSTLLAVLARAACRFAEVRRGDMWAGSWAGLDLVYLFQRPESMSRALAKAEAEMADGGWLASLEFAVPGRTAHAVLRCPDGRPLWLYRVPARP